jgi:hypothetical protein
MAATLVRLERETCALKPIAVNVGEAVAPAIKQQSYGNHMAITWQSCTNHTPIIYQSHTNHMPITRRNHSTW